MELRSLLISAYTCTNNFFITQLLAKISHLDEISSFKFLSNFSANPKGLWVNLGHSFCQVVREVHNSCDVEDNPPSCFSKSKSWFMLRRWQQVWCQNQFEDWRGRPQHASNLNKAARTETVIKTTKRRNNQDLISDPIRAYLKNVKKTYTFETKKLQERLKRFTN